MCYAPFNSIVSVGDAAEALAVGLDGADLATTSGRCPFAVNSAFMCDVAFSMSRLSGRRDGMRKLGDVPGLSGSTSASVLV